MDQLTLAWTAPEDDGGCPITSYAVFRDDGAASEVNIEVNTDSDTNVRNKPALRSLTITDYPTVHTGLIFQYRVQAISELGADYYTYSETVSYILADIPSAPANGPQDTVTETTSSQIKVSFDPLTTEAQTGGSSILSYNLQVDDGLGGDFIDLFGQNSDVLST